MILFRGGHDLDALPEPDTRHQYFPPSLPRPQEPLCLVDGGAYTGDTLQDMIGHDLAIESVFAFEPDLTNFRQLTTQIRDTLAARARCLAWPCGLWSSTTCLRFDAGGSASSRIDEQSADMISVVALDDVLQGERVNFVKMDIEGAEPDALAGARNIIVRQRPTLAVCVYHRPEHIYSLAEQIQGFGVSYRYFLRSHAYNTFDLVLYAVPA